MNHSSKSLMEKLLSLQKSENFLEILLLDYLKRFIRIADVSFGSFFIFKKEKNDFSLITMKKIGEYEKKEKILKRMEEERKKGIIPHVIHTMKPYITNDCEKDPFHVSFRKEKILSEMVIPFDIDQERIGILVLPSMRKNHFKESHLKRILPLINQFLFDYLFLLEFFRYLKEKKGFKKDSYYIRQGSPNIILYNCSATIMNSIKNILNSFNTIDTYEIKEMLKILEEKPIEFILMDCNFKCHSNRCWNLFHLLKGNSQTPLGIIRQLGIKELKKDILSKSFLCSFFHNENLAQKQKNIMDLIKKSRYYGCSPQFGIHESQNLYRIAKIQRSLIEEPFHETRRSFLARSVNLSPSHLSYIFRKITGQSLEEFSIKVKMCHSLWILLSEDKSVKEIALSKGYHDPLSFTKCFTRIFGFPPSSIRKKS
ncbi:MAG: helix-turn-helix domain-containing protein [Acidobacteriota bacterium]